MYPLYANAREVANQTAERARDRRALLLFALGAVLAMVLSLLQGPVASPDELAIEVFADGNMPSQTVEMSAGSTAEGLRMAAADEPAPSCQTRLLRRTSNRVGLAYPPSTWVGMAVLDLADWMGGRTCTPSLQQREPTGQR
jgi:hypothetical protein